MDATDGEFDVEAARREHESDKEWGMRRSFILANHSDISSIDRLVCLSNCYLNMEVYGCSYPIAVMQEVRELAERIPQSSAEPQYKSSKRAKYENLVPFVKQKEIDKRDRHTAAAAAAAAAAVVTTSATPGSAKKKDEQPFPASSCAQQDQMSSCLLELDRCLENGIIGRSFILHRAAGQNVDNEQHVNIVTDSFHLNHIPIKWVFEQRSSSPAITECILYVTGVPAAKGCGTSKMTAKRAVSQIVHDWLKGHFWTILSLRGCQVKSNDAIDKDTLFDSSFPEVDSAGAVSSAGSTAMSKNSVGGKLLQKLGWQGGGLGKSSDGIEKPVELIAVINREGLGFKKCGYSKGEFRSAVDRLLTNFAMSGNGKDMSFSEEFTQDERCVIHHMARKYGFRSKSYGKAASRYLIVRRHRTPAELLEHIQQAGGSTDKYRAIPPSSSPG